jgi:hypothetical protein
MSANSRYKTHRGREFNMSAFADKNGDTKVVGNVSMNARGDIIDAKGNVKIPTQTISRMAADLKNNESRHVGLKADSKISAPAVETEPAAEPNLSVYNDERLVSNFDKMVEEPEPNVISTRDVETPDGTAVEIEYDDGSIEIVLKEDM